MLHVAWFVELPEDADLEFPLFCVVTFESVGVLAVEDLEELRSRSCSPYTEFVLRYEKKDRTDWGVAFSSAFARAERKSGNYDELLKVLEKVEEAEQISRLCKVTAIAV